MTADRSNFSGYRFMPAMPFAQVSTRLSMKKLVGSFCAWGICLLRCRAADQLQWTVTADRPDTVMKLGIDGKTLFSVYTPINAYRRSTLTCSKLAPTKTDRWRRCWNSWEKLAARRRSGFMHLSTTREIPVSPDFLSQRTAWRFHDEQRYETYKPVINGTAKHRYFCCRRLVAYNNNVDVISKRKVFAV